MDEGTHPALTEVDMGGLAVSLYSTWQAELGIHLSFNPCRLMTAVVHQLHHRVAGHLASG